MLLEVFSWTGADKAFTSITGGEARLADLHISIAALLVSEACNIGWTPVIKHSVPALTRDRLAHVDATYLRMDTLKAANTAWRLRRFGGWRCQPFGAEPGCGPTLRVYSAATAFGSTTHRLRQMSQVVRPALVSQMCSQVADAFCNFSRDSCEAW